MGCEINNLVSIIVPVYNTGELLRKCIDSLLAQIYSPIEIVLVDDGSKDNSFAICNEYKLKHKNIQVIHQENSGVSVARNKALDVTRGEYIAFCDSDDYVLPEMIGTLVKTMEDSNSDISSCGFFRDTELSANQSQKGVWEIKRLHRHEMESEVLSNPQCAGYLWNKLFRKKYIDCNEPLKFQYDIAVLEDLLFVVEYLKRVSNMCFTPEKLYVYRDNPNGVCREGVSNRRLSSVMARERIYKIIESNLNNNNSEQIAWNQLMQSYVYYFKDLLKNHGLENRKFWLDYISKGFGEYKNRHHYDNRWTKKAKVYLAMLSIYTKLR